MERETESAEVRCPRSREVEAASGLSLCPEGNRPALLKTKARERAGTIVGKWGHGAGWSQKRKFPGAYEGGSVQRREARMQGPGWGCKRILMALGNSVQSDTVGHAECGATGWEGRLGCVVTAFLLYSEEWGFVVSSRE